MQSNRTWDDLPDDIVGRILALLPTKDRAMSEAVSKSWRRASLGKDWERICLDPLGSAQIRWLKLMASRNPSSLHVFEGDTLPHTVADTVVHLVSCFQNLRHLELNTMYLDPSRVQRLSHLTNLERLVCNFIPYDFEENHDFPENDIIDLAINLDSFANFPQLRHLAVALCDMFYSPGDTVLRVSLGSRFQGLTQLRSLKLEHMFTLDVDANLLQVAARLEHLELESLHNGLSLENQELNTPQLTRFVYKVAASPLAFPLTAAPRLLELTLHGRNTHPVTQALQVCPKLTALDLVMDANVRMHISDVLEWPEVSMCLRRLDIMSFRPSPNQPCALHAFSAYTRLETLRLKLLGGRNNVLASPNTMQHLKVLMLAIKDLEPFDLGRSLNHLPRLKILQLSVPHLTGEINLSSLEVLKLSFSSFKSEIKPGHRLLGNLSRLHTLHIQSELCNVTEIFILAHAIGALRSLRDVVLLRMSHDTNAPRKFKDLGFTRIMLRSISNTSNVYNHVAIVDDGAVVLERSSMPRARHLELVCDSLNLESEQPGEDWFHRTSSLRVRLMDINGSFESTPASVVEKLRSSPHLRIRRIQREVSPTLGYGDYIEASKYEFSSLPPWFLDWSIWSSEKQDWC